MNEQKNTGKTYIVDIDDTLIIYPDSHMNYEDRGAQERYVNGVPNIKEVNKLNELYKLNTIILLTGRGWHHLEFTKVQLEMYGINYHSLVMGKPPGIYVDADALKELP